MKNKKLGLIVTLALGLLAVPGASWAQPVTQPPRIGVLRFGPLPSSFIQPFRRELRELGYVEGQSIILEHRIAQSVAQLPGLAT